MDGAITIGPVLVLTFQIFLGLLLLAPALGYLIASLLDWVIYGR